MKKIALIILSLTLFINICFAQKKQLRFEQISANNDLSMSTVRCIFQDRQGFLWFGNKEGLYQYDGYKFVPYRKVPGNVNSLSSNDVKSIVDDKDGNLWIATWDGGLNFLDLKTRGFKHYTNNPHHNSISSNFLEGLFRDSQNQIWIATADAGLNLLNIKTGAFQVFKHTDNPASISDNSVTAICEDNEKKFWVGTNNGLNLFDKKTQTFQHFFHDPQNPNSISDNRIKFLYDDKNGSLWIGTYNGGLNRLELRTKRFTSYNTKNSKISSNALLSIVKGPDENLWIGTDKGGLDIFDTKTANFRVYKNNYTDLTSISSNTIDAVYKDIKGNIWLGTLNGGICLIRKDVYNFTYYKYDSKNNSLSNNVVNSVFEDSKNRLWVGTDGGGLDLLDRKKGIFKNLLSGFNDPDATQNYVCSISEDSNGNIWLGSWGGGVTIYNPSTGSTKTFKHTADTKSLANDYVFYVFKDSNHKMWIGTYGGGLDYYNPQKDSFVHYQLNGGSQKSTNLNNILTINEDNDKNLLIGTDGAGLVVLNLISNKVSNYNFDTKLSLSNNSVNTIYPENNGDIWLGTNNGLNKLNIKAQKAIHYYKEDGLASNIITSILADKRNNLWLGTNNGLTQFDRNRKFKTYTNSDGLSSNDFRFSKCLTQSGTMFFGTIKGLNEFIPDSIHNFQYDSPIVFTDFQIFYDHVEPNVEIDGHKVLDYGISNAKEINLSYKQSVLTFEFASLNYVNKDREQYLYILEGFDNQWHNLGTKNAITFTNLDPGSYTLKVRGLNNNGLLSNKIAWLKLNISPPFWKTWWFNLLLLLCIASLVLSFFYWRIRSIKNHNRQLEMEVSKRTYELKNANQKLIATNEKIQIQNQELALANNDISLKSKEIIDQQEQIVSQNSKLEHTVNELKKSNNSKDKFFSILAHDLRNPISAIAGIAKSLTEQISRLNKNEIYNYITSINDSSKSVLELLINLLEWAKTQTQSIKPHFQNINLYEIISSNQILMVQQMRDKNIFLTVNVNLQHNLYADKKMVETIVRNLLSNCIKFTMPYGQIVIDSNERENDVIITFHDTGMGMTEEQIKNIFTADSITSSLGSSGETGSGLGLIIIKEFVDANNGKIKVSSSLNEGTTFSISLPKGKSTIHDVYNDLHQSSQTTIYEDIHSEKLFDQKKLKLQGKKVLYVDDNQEMRGYLGLLLSPTFDFVAAKNGQEGMKSAIDFQPEIIITDMLMPVIDGMELCKRLKQNPLTSHIPIVLLTSQIDIANQIGGYEAGADSYLTKPVNPKLLFQVIYNLINNRENARLKFNNSEDIYPGNFLYNARDKDFMAQVIDYIEQNINEHTLDSKKLSETISMSRTILYAKIKALTGLGVNEFIQSIRVKKALQLLMIGRLNINQIAYEVGFQNPSYFSKCFTKQFGVPPKEYLTRLKNQNKPG